MGSNLGTIKAVIPHASPCATCPVFAEFVYTPGDWLLFGAETTGLPMKGRQSCKESVEPPRPMPGMMCKQTVHSSGVLIMFLSIVVHRWRCQLQSAINICITSGFQCPDTILWAAWSSCLQLMKTSGHPMATWPRSQLWTLM